MTPWEAGWTLQGLLPHVVEAAMMLGLLRQRDGDLEVTEQGKRAVKVSGRALRALIKDLGDDVEPFREIFESLKGDTIEAGTLREIVSRSGYPDVDRAVEVFREWLAYMGVEVVD